MQVLFSSRTRDANDMRETAIGRVKFVMRRLTWLVPRATVRLSDVNGPRGGLDKQCQIALRVEGRRTVVITALARDWRGALDGALARSRRLLLRIWRRERRMPALTT
jgi:hypothetical protein